MNVIAAMHSPDPSLRPAGRQQSANRLSPLGLATVATLHAVLFYGLLSMNAIRLPAQLPVLSIDLLVPPAPEPQPEPLKPEVVPPKPRPMEKAPTTRPVEAPQLALPADAPVAAPAIEVPVAVEPVPTQPLPAPAPAAPSQPLFDADYLDNPKPVYPNLSRRLKEEGRVVLRVQVAATGLPTDVAVRASSGHVRLDQAALEAVRRWKFVPARLGTEAVAASVLVPIDFSLKN